MTTITPPAYITQADEALDKGYDPKVVRGLLPFLKPYIGQGIAAILLMTVATFTSVAGPYFVKMAIDSGITAHDSIALERIVLLYFAVSVVQVVTNYFRVRIMSRVGQH